MINIVFFLFRHWKCRIWENVQEWKLMALQWLWLQVTSRQTRAIAMNMLKLSILFMRDTHVHFVGRLWKQAIRFGIIRLNTILWSNKMFCFCLDIETAIAEKMYKNGGLWYCNDCDYKTPNKSHCYEHVEAKHIVHGGYTCPICGKILKTSGSYRVHQIKSHPQ